MSQDLFAAFGEANVRPSDNQSNKTSDEVSSAILNTVHAPRTSLPKLQSIGSVVKADPQEEDHEDFGEFEDASLKPSYPTSAHPSDPGTPFTALKDTSPPQQSRSSRQNGSGSTGRHPFAGNMEVLFSADDDEYDAGEDELDDLSKNPEAAMAYSKHIIAVQPAEQKQIKVRRLSIESEKDPSQQTNQTQQPRATTKHKVLFDAGVVSDEDGDDFGDFQEDDESRSVARTASTTAPHPSGSITTPAIDLLYLDESSKGAETVDPEIKAKMKIPAARSSARIAQSAATSRHEQLIAPDDEVWDDFGDSAPSVVPRTAGDKVVPDKRAVDSDSNAGTQTKPLASVNALPPTNVPPPAVLLSLFPLIFDSAEEALFRSLSKLDAKQRQILLGHPATQKFLRSYLNTTIVLGHIIGGRKLRWKRDQQLSQSMRIGPATAGGRGGMKLTGIDKSELAKEDREVLDTVRQWKLQVGKLRNAITTATSATESPPNLPIVPEIAEQMPVKSLKIIEGGVTAPRACVLCGLKREERVAKVDVEVDDSFGEWWLQDLSMHLSCHHFWEEHKGRLRTR